MSNFDNHSNILFEELICALGCTEPIAIAYAGALIRTLKEDHPDHIEVHCSSNIIKNVKSVVVPNSGDMVGINAAAILGLIAGNAEKKLEVLNDVTEADCQKTRELLDSNFASIHLAENVPNLYIEIRAFYNNDTAKVVISDRHTNVVKLALNDRNLLDHNNNEVLNKTVTNNSDCNRENLTVASILEFTKTIPLKSISPLIEQQLKCNLAIAQEGLQGNWGYSVGKTILESCPKSVENQAKALAAAGSDARMNGCPLPVVIVCGSGNQGMTTSLPLVPVAKSINASNELLHRAIILSNLVAVHVKYNIGELSAFCGAVSAACGVAAAICYLKNGSITTIESAIDLTLANVAGIICDGAKSSCALKICSSLDAAFLASSIALNNTSSHSFEGIIGKNCEATIENIGEIARGGMKQTDRDILKILTRS